MGRNTNLDEIKMRAEVSSNMFADRLYHFIKRWEPKGPQGQRDFQMDMTRLMVDAMRHKSEVMGLGIETYASHVYTEMAMRPLFVIREDKKDG